MCRDAVGVAEARVEEREQWRGMCFCGSKQVRTQPVAATTNATPRYMFLLPFPINVSCIEVTDKKDW
jgi:hypothetical protein